MIIASAIKFIPHFSKYPVIICGKRHADCLEEAFQMGYEWDKEDLVQGFLTDDAKFLDRYDAKPEARRCRQLIVDDDKYRELFSEDMWLEED